MSEETKYHDIEIIYQIEWCDEDSYQPSSATLCACKSEKIAQDMIDHFFKWRAEVGKTLPLAPPAGKEREEFWEMLREKTVKAPFGWGVEKNFLGWSTYVNMDEFHSPDFLKPPEDWTDDEEEWYTPPSYKIKPVKYISKLVL